MEGINEVSLFHLIIVSYTGALIGEVTRSLECTEPISLTLFSAELLASGFLGIMIALALKGTILRDKPIAVLGAAGIFGYSDRKTCLQIIDKIPFMDFNKTN